MIEEFPLVHVKSDYPKFKYAADKIGHRNKIGGTPDWIQVESYPTCTTCNKKMIFYGQLDSVSDEYMIGDCGLIFVFICFECNEAKAIVQSY